MERRQRGLALLHRGRATVLPAEKASKPDPAGIRRVDRIVHQFRALFVVVPPGLAATAVVAQTKRKRILRRIEQRHQLERAHPEEDARVQLHAAAGS